MPRLTFPILQSGLAVPVWVGLDGKTTAALQDTGQRIPPPLAARGLVDTCSDLTAIAPWLVQTLGLPIITMASMRTASGQAIVNLYEVSLSITDPTQPRAAMQTHADVLVSELAVTLPDADVLIGLDILLTCKLLVDGSARQFTLEF